MKTITITGQWINGFSTGKRADIMRVLFSLAASEHFDIRVAGLHWSR